MDITINPLSILQKSWEQLKNYFGRHLAIMVSLGILYFLIGFLLNALLMGGFKAQWELWQQAASASNPNEIIMQYYMHHKGGLLINSLLSALINIIFANLFLGYGLDTAKNRYAGFNTLLQRYLSWKKIFHMFMLELFFIFVLFIPAFMLFFLIPLVLGKIPFLAIILDIALVIAFLYVLVRLSLSPFYILDRDDDFLTALTESWNDTAPHVFSMWVFLMIIMSLGVIMLIVMVFVAAALIALFEKVSPAMGILIFTVLYFLTIFMVELLELFGFADYYVEITRNEELSKESHSS